MSDLQKFVIKFFNTLGAVVEEVEYALMDVLVEDEFKDIFGKTELKLCFDYEVYLENPKYELVTFGSFILDKIVDLSFKFSNNCIRYAIADNLKVTEPEKKIKRSLNLDRSNVEIIEENMVINYFVKYSFKVQYVSDNTIEEFEDVVVDMRNLCVSQEFLKNIDAVFYESKQLYDYPINCNTNFLEGLKEALKDIEKVKQIKTDTFSSKLVINRETERIILYYDSLKQEAEKRMTRKNLSEEKINDYKHKIEIYNIEKQRQINEITEKYSIKSHIFLENAVVYAVPMVVFKYNLTGRNKADEDFKCIYNTILKDFEQFSIKI
jgi:hypothetical protein